MTERALFVFLKSEFFHRFEVGKKTVEIRQFENAADLRWSPKHVRQGRPVILRRGMSTLDEIRGFVGRAVWVNRFDALPEWARAGCGVGDKSELSGAVDPERPLVAFEVVPEFKLLAPAEPEDAPAIVPRRVNASAADVLDALRGLRAGVVVREHDLHVAIARALDRAGIPYAREARLGPGNVIDFLAGAGVGIEVKKGRPLAARLSQQVERYCAFPSVRELVIVVERHVSAHSRTSANGKPVHYLPLHKQWGIALP